MTFNQISNKKRSKKDNVLLFYSSLLSFRHAGDTFPTFLELSSFWIRTKISQVLISRFFMYYVPTFCFNLYFNLSNAETISIFFCKKCSLSNIVLTFSFFLHVSRSQWFFSNWLHPAVRINCASDLKNFGNSPTWPLILKKSFWTTRTIFFSDSTPEQFLKRIFNFFYLLFLALFGSLKSEILELSF